MSSPAVARASPGGNREAAGGPRSRNGPWEVGGGERLERAGAEPGRWELLLRRGELLALGGHLKGALEAFAAALRRGAPARPERLGSLVDCLVFSYRLRHGLRWSATPAAGAAGLLSCLGCRGFLSEPVTVPCGHSYCRRCLRRELRARCRLCRDRLPPAAAAEGTPRPPPLAAAIADFRTSVVLNHLAEKWFPGQRERARAAGRLGELLHQGRYREALAAACDALRAGDAGLRCGAGRTGIAGVGGGGAPGCFGHGGDRLGASSDAARGGARTRVSFVRARRAGDPGRGAWARGGRVGGGRGLPAARCPRTPAGVGQASPGRGGARGYRVYLGLTLKSLGQLEAAGGQNCISWVGGRCVTGDVRWAWRELGAGTGTQRPSGGRARSWWPAAPEVVSQLLPESACTVACSWNRHLPITDPASIDSGCAPTYPWCWWRGSLPTRVCLTHSRPVKRSFVGLLFIFSSPRSSSFVLLLVNVCLKMALGCEKGSCKLSKTKSSSLDI